MPGIPGIPPGGIPGIFIPGGILGMEGIPLPPIIRCIIFCIWVKFFSSWLTSRTVVPEPLAMRSRRLVLISLGLSRSALVMELMMASTRPISFSGICTSPSCLRTWDMPGMSLSSPSRDPSFLMRRIWVRKSSRVNWALRSLRSISAASSASTSVWAFSMSVRMSPMPRMREAARSG